MGSACSRILFGASGSVSRASCSSFWSYGFIWYGTALLRAQIGLSAFCGLLIAASLLAPVMVFEDILIGYVPNGPVLPYIVAWSLLRLQTTFRTPITSTAR